jgi:hydrogenase maturation protease
MLMTTTMAMTTRRRQPNILIAGLGNLLLQDDGVGVHAVHELKKAPPPGALVTEIGTWVLQGLHLYEWADKVLVLDAMQAGGDPGTLYACRDEDVADPGIEASLHELGLMAALKFIKPEKRPEVYVLGVEPLTIDYGLELTPPVKAALPRFVELARERVDRWRLES